MATRYYKIPEFGGIAIPPGESLAEEIECIGMTQRELAKRLDMSPQEIGELIRGEMAVTQDIAEKLEEVLGSPASLWLGLEDRYQRTKAHLEAREKSGVLTPPTS